MIDRFGNERNENWREWLDKIPYLKFDKDWSVQVIPPFAGALIRFRVKKGKADISVYLDVNQSLGFCDKPYWEIYPHHHGDAYRCYMEETDKLLRAIRTSIKKANQ